MHIAKVSCERGDGTDQELLFEENISTTDAFVALGNIDEQNIIMSMFAASQNVPKVITKIDQLGYYDMLQKSGIYSAVSTKNSTANHIIRFVRLLSNKSGSTVKRMFHIVDDSTKILEFEANANFKKFDIPLQKLNLKKHLLVAGIIRKGVLIGYNKKGKAITIEMMCIRKMMKLINRKTSDYKRSVSLDALTPVSEPYTEMKEEVTQDYAKYDKIVESLNLTENMRIALECRITGLSFPEIGRVLSRAQTTVFEYFIKMRKRYNAIYG